MQWDQLYRNVNLVTLSDQASYCIITNAAIAVTGDEISWLGPSSDLPESATAKQEFDTKGYWLTPGLIDCHTHIIYAGDRSNEFAQRLTGVSYANICEQGGGILSTVAATRKISESELYELSKQRIQNWLQQGVTNLEIKSGYGLDLETELKILRIARRLNQELPITIHNTLLAAHTLPLEYANKSDEYIDYICKEILPAAVAADLVDHVDAFCETIGFSCEQVAKIFKTAEEYNLPVKCHAEQLSDQNSASLAAQYKALSADHLEFANHASLQQMAAQGTCAVLLPGAFYYLQQQQLPPIARMRELNIPMAIATDCNPGTSPIFSLLTILNMASVLFKLTPEESLAGVTCNAAKALGIQHHYGSLSVGKKADFAFWNIQHPDELSCKIGINPCVGIVKHGRIVKGFTDANNGAF